MPEERNENLERENNNSSKNSALWPWILAGGMLGSSIIMCLCGRGCTKAAGCRDCNEPKKDTVWVVKDDPAIKVDGDAIIIKGDNNDATLIKGNGNNAANRSSGTQNQNRGAVKPKPKPVKPIVKPAPVIEPDVEPVVKPEPQPQEQTCTTTTTTTRTRVIISGNANDVTRAAVQILNGNCR